MKMHRTMAVACVLAAMVCGRGEAATRYVDANVSGGLNNGSSWANAYTTLTNAIKASVSNSADEIWVAQGTYYPTSAIGNADARFTPRAGTFLYGGFTNGMATRAERNWDAYPTILSGDIDQDGLLDTDNSYTVLYTYGVSNWWVDGFTITMGARGQGTSGGAGVYAGNANTVAGMAGTLANCRIVSNACLTTLSGAGMNIGGGDYTNPAIITITNCTFSQNRALGSSSSGGAGLALFSGNTTVIDCKFFDNRTWGGGSALSMSRSPAVLIQNCVFAANVSTGSSAAISIPTALSSMPIKNVVITNCIFSDNRALTYSSAVTVGSDYISNVTVVGCTFSGNDLSSSSLGGGAVRLQMTGGNPVPVRNCLFAGNYAAAGSAALEGVVTHARIDIDNSVFAHNQSGGGNKGVVSYGSTASNTIRNTIFWGNQMATTPTNIYTGNGYTQTVSYTVIQGFSAGSVSSPRVLDVAGNTNVNPAFADGPASTWTAAGVYNPQRGQTELKHTGAGWTVNRWAGTLINPNTTQMKQYYVASNSADTLYMWGDASALATLGASYQGYDYHLKSMYGRYTAAGWVNDTTNSPLIDAGYPLSDCSLEPKYNGGRINIGVYGNTAQASKSKSASGTLTMIK